MTIDTDKLKALALAATKGPWMRLFGERTVYDRMEDGCRGNAIVRADVGFSKQDADNLDFIAAACPATVLELIAEVERLRAVAAARPQIDERYEFERHMSQRGDAANYIGDGMYHSGAVQDQWEAWFARAAIEAHAKASKEKV
jgi:hypothetical protein